MEGDRERRTQGVEAPAIYHPPVHPLPPISPDLLSGDELQAPHRARLKRGVVRVERRTGDRRDQVRGDEIVDPLGRLRVITAKANAGERSRARPRDQRVTGVEAREE